MRGADLACRHPLGLDLRARVLVERLEEPRQRGDQAGVQRGLDGLLAHGDDVGEPDPVGRQHPGQGMDQHRRHAQRVGHGAGVLAARAAEHVQDVLGHVVAALHRNLLDRVGHVGHGDLDEADRDLLGPAAVAGGPGDLAGERLELHGGGLGVQRLVATGAENAREMGGLDAAEQDVGVGQRERAAVAVAGGPGVGPRGVRADPVPAAVEVQHRAAARGHGVDGQHGGPHPDPGDLRLVLALEVPRVVRHVGRRAAHVEPDHLGEAGVLCGSRHADDAAGRAGQDRVLAAEAGRVGQAAVGLHEQEPDVLELGRHLSYVSLQNRRQVGVHHRGVAPGDQLHQRAGPVRLRDLGEARRTGQVADPSFVIGVPVAVHADDGHGPEAVVVGVREGLPDRVLVQGREHLAAGRDPLAGLDYPVVQHLGQQDPAVEDPGPVLVGDAQGVGETLGNDQDGGFARALEQGVGGHRGTEPDLPDAVGGDVLAGSAPEQLPDAGHRGVPVGAGIIGEQLVRDQPPVRAPGDDVGERAAPVDPEFPPSVHRTSVASPGQGPE